jgi:4-oxalmesaconate hydratase
VGRWRSQLRGPNDTETFDQRLKQLYFDTALYNVESLKLLFRICGPKRCLFGTERPGAGSKIDPRTGKWYDDVRPNIESIPWLTAEEKTRIFEKNALEVFSRFKQ